MLFDLPAQAGDLGIFDPVEFTFAAFLYSCLGSVVLMVAIHRQEICLADHLVNVCHEASVYLIQQDKTNYEYHHRMEQERQHS